MEIPLSRFGELKQQFGHITDPDEQAVAILEAVMPEDEFALWQVINMLHGDGWFGPQGYSEKKEGPYACKGCVKRLIDLRHSREYWKIEPRVEPLGTYLEAAIIRCGEEHKE